MAAPGTLPCMATSDSLFQATPRLLATPHIGYVTEGGYRIFYSQVVENIEAFLAGSPIRVI